MKNWLHPDMTKFIVSYNRPSPEMKAFREKAQDAHVPIIHEDVERMICWLIKARKVKRILEVGTATGYSATAFIQAMGSGEVVTIELNEKRHLEALENFKEFGISDQITAIHGSAQDTIETLSGPFDMIFIDAAKSHYNEFLHKALPLMSEGGIIVSDNVLYGGRVAAKFVEKRNRTSTRHMLNYLDHITKPPFDTVILPIGDGLSLTTWDEGEIHAE